MPERIFVSLSGENYFYCPPCGRSSLHPPRDIYLEYYVIGYAFCPGCFSWFPIKGGDGCGVVGIDADGDFYTILASGKRVVKGRLVD